MLGSCGFNAPSLHTWPVSLASRGSNPWAPPVILQRCMQASIIFTILDADKSEELKIDEFVNLGFEDYLGIPRLVLPFCLFPLREE